MPSVSADPNPDTTRALLLGLLLAALLIAAQVWRYPPTPVSSDAVATEFSALRAVDALREVLADERPHPVGSAANRAVRDRLIASLDRLGYVTRIQTARACHEWGQCATVDNLVVRIEGRTPGPAIALTAHYDSVAAGPGAGDDGVGIAALLEIARLLKARQQPLRQPVLLLFTDGEEAGLIGAKAFVDQHPWAAEVTAAINIEARGNTGPSFMFETGDRNLEAMRHYRSARPLTNSIYYTAYRLLPNDTDFSVFKAAGWQGYNLALTGRVQHYHTPLDRLAHLSLASVQHHGDNALALLLALADAAPAGSTTAAGADAVYVDLLASTVLVWPAAWAVPLAIGCGLLWLLLTGLLRHRQGLTPAALASTIGRLLLAPLLAAAVMAALLAGLRWLGAMPPVMATSRWSAEAWPLNLAAAGLAALVTGMVAAGSGRTLRLAACWSAIGGLLWVATLASAVCLPGLSFAFQLPLTVLLLVATPLMVTRPAGGETLLIASLLLAGLAGVLVLLPTIGFLHQSLGPDALIAAAALLAWIGLPMLGLLALARTGLRRGLLGLALSATVAGAVLAATGQPYSADSPQRLNIEYQLEIAGAARQPLWLLRPDSGTLSTALAAAAPFAVHRPALPWLKSRIWQSAAPDLGLAAPEFYLQSAAVEGAGVRYQGRLVSPRGARMISLCWPPGLLPVDIAFGDQHLPEPDDHTRALVDRHRPGGWRCISEHTLAPEGVVLAFRLPTAAVAELLLFDQSSGLPAEGQPLLQARSTDAVPSREGDLTRVLRRIRIVPP